MEQPRGDEGLVSYGGYPGGRVHDVQVRGVERQGFGGQVVSHKVHLDKEIQFS